MSHVRIVRYTHMFVSIHPRTAWMCCSNQTAMLLLLMPYSLPCVLSLQNPVHKKKEASDLTPSNAITPF
jgi:hypothetical protein